MTDLASAHILALEKLLHGYKTDCVNLGTGHGSSIKQVIDICKKVSKKIDTNYVDRRKGDPAVLVASNKKAFEVLSWSPTLDLETQVHDGLNWYEKKFTY